MKISLLTKILFLLLTFASVYTTLTAQDNDYLELKERYIGGEIESGIILSEPAYSIGIGVGRVHSEHLQVGLTLHFLLNDLVHNVANGTEELRKLTLLGLEMQYRNRFTGSLGYYGGIVLNLGSAEHHHIVNSQNIRSTGFTIAVKPKAGLFYKINRRSRVYVGVKYMHGFIFKGREFYQGVPLISLGVRFHEIAF